MMFTAHYQSPLGEILLAADEVGLTGLWWAEPWDITPFRLSSRATVWWVPAAA